MTTLSHFVAALRAHLLKRDVKTRVSEYRNLNNGCPTCGYGSEEVDAIDWDKLIAEIDAFAAAFIENSEGI